MVQQIRHERQYMRRVVFTSTIAALGVNRLDKVAIERHDDLVQHRAIAVVGSLAEPDFLEVISGTAPFFPLFGQVRPDHIIDVTPAIVYGITVGMRWGRLPSVIAVITVDMLDQ